ncbi:hypothetical protein YASMINEVIRUS_697 [Yasminevirus sp. GU-2018]|uniref:Uncharacterized protein n=1 Tax=Yasminevirus sp. GU-2018 TaxID=2420051 RepID=A0A5K0U9T1_9VIRU|nr:hypothetical protein YASMINEVIRUS_697 [Yasminevirus sp. GU-2018]
MDISTDNNRDNNQDYNQVYNQNYSQSHDTDYRASCISYESSTFELFIPSPIIFSTFCVSTDRTSLFIVSVVRVLFYVILYYVLNDIIDMEQYRYIKYVLLMMIIVNIVYVGFVVSKDTTFSIGADKSMFAKTEVQNSEQIHYSL